MNSAMVVCPNKNNKMPAAVVASRPQGAVSATILNALVRQAAKVANKVAANKAVKVAKAADRVVKVVDRAAETANPSTLHKTFKGTNCPFFHACPQRRRIAQEERMAKR
jgi:hypothetical protein